MSQDQNILPKLLFVSNLLKAVKIRERVPNDLAKPNPARRLIHHLKIMHRYTLEMFRMSQFPLEFREVIQAAILDRGMQTSLEQEKKLNWCREVKRLVPLRTNGDGNCLLHAASQFMWGVEDTDLVLRKALYGALKETDTRNFKVRFQMELILSQEFTETGLRYNSLNWEEEWDKVVEMASPSHSHSGLQYDSLEDIHIFVLANILRRPIIIIADQVLRSMESGSSFSPLNVGGIYLPLHWPVTKCYRYPIVLGYDSQHFAPLITIKDSGPEIRAIPLEYPGRGVLEKLKVHFLHDNERPECEKLIKEYLMLMEIPVQGFSNDTTHMVTAARLDEENLPEDMNLMEDYLQLVNHEYKRWQENAKTTRLAQPGAPTQFSVSQLSLIQIKCATNKCSFYVSVETQPYCHECFENRRGASRRPEPKPRSQSPQGSHAELHNGVWTASPSPRSAPPTAPSLSLYSETHAMKCKTPNCLFTLSVEHNGLCKQCFNLRNGNPPAPPRDSQGQGSREVLRCRLCQGEASRNMNGQCISCLQRTGSHPTSRVDPTQPPRGWPLLSGSSSGCEDAGVLGPGPEIREGQLCKKQGCTFYGTAAKLGFCTMCFEEYDMNHAEVAQQRRSPAPGRSCSEDLAYQNSSICLQHNCTRPGNSMYEGYCENCFMSEQSKRLIMRATQPRPMQNNVKCSHSGCNNLTAVQEQLCPECRTRGLRDRHGRQTPEEPPKQRCQAQGCDHYANHEKQGFCNECDHFKRVLRS
ncbi:tumor necrosis factor alpha-induced protein 3 isoform X1 [Amia ocellicauda]|uniref:tumor necrosis factor alpha-induced protein 3 isoform X1 n=1 Tax=Amia ocellicauda TaxID=2972642 RepID=UPI0034649193